MHYRRYYLSELENCP